MSISVQLFVVDHVTEVPLEGAYVEIWDAQGIRQAPFMTRKVVDGTVDFTASSQAVQDFYGRDVSQYFFRVVETVTLSDGNAFDALWADTLIDEGSWPSHGAFEKGVIVQTQDVQATLPVSGRYVAITLEDAQTSQPVPNLQLVPRLINGTPSIELDSVVTDSLGRAFVRVHTSTSVDVELFQEREPLPNRVLWQSDVPDESRGVVETTESVQSEFGGTIQVVDTDGAARAGAVLELFDDEHMEKGPLRSVVTNGNGEADVVFSYHDLIQYYGRFVNRFVFRVWEQDRLVLDSKADEAVNPPAWFANGVWELEDTPNISSLTLTATAQFADISIVDADSEAPRVPTYVQLFATGMDPKSQEPLEVAAVDEVGQATFRRSVVDPLAGSDSYFFNIVEEGFEPLDVRPIDALDTPGSPDDEGYWYPTNPGPHSQFFSYQVTRSGRLRIAGTLLDSNTGDGLAGVRVAFFGAAVNTEPSSTTVTDQEGSFDFSVPERVVRSNRGARVNSKLVFMSADEIVLQVTEVDSGDLPSESLEFQLAEDDFDIEVETDATAVVGLLTQHWETRGVLTDSADGSPLTGFEITAYEVIDAETEHLRTTTWSNSAGYFALEWREPYDATASSQRSMRFEVRSSDGLTDVSVSQTVDLSVEEFTLSISPSSELAGDYQAAYFDLAAQTSYEVVADAAADAEFDGDYITPAVDFRKATVQDRLVNLTALGLKGEWSSNQQSAIVQPAELPETCSCGACTSAGSMLAYLMELVGYASERSTVNGSAANLQSLSDALGQPIVDFKLNCDASRRDVSQNRIAVEALRQKIEEAYQEDTNQTHLSREAIRDSEGVKEYRRRAYFTVLRELDTSFAELRELPSGASSRPGAEEARAAVADRLSISKADLAELILDPSADVGSANAISEEALERLFGLMATEYDELLDTDPAKPVPDPLRELPTPQFVDFQRNELLADWAVKDRPADADVWHPPIVDPDIVGVGEVVPGTNAATRLQERMAWLDGRIGTIASAIDAQTTDVDRLDEALYATQDLGFIDEADGMGAWEKYLSEPAQNRSNGEEYESAIAAHHLTIQAFDYLTAVRDEIDAGNAIEQGHWDNVVSVLAAAEKRANFATWRGEENTDNIILSPEDFRLLPIEDYDEKFASAPENFEFRFDIERRLDWADTLKQRTIRLSQLTENVQNAVAEAEARCLPLLRDELISLYAENQGDSHSARAHWAGEQLYLDMQQDGATRTTRVVQAVESLQMLMYEARVGTAQSTEFTFDLDPYDFDEIWPWLGSYRAWRSAVSVATYPENYLDILPRRTATPQFDSLRQELAWQPTITPEAACQIADQYEEEVHLLSSLGHSGVVATCEAKVRVSVTDLCERTSYNYRDFIFVFSEIRGRNWWSRVDKETGRQTPWKRLPGTSDKFVEVFGAIQYKKEVLVFYRHVEDGKHKLSVLKFDTKADGWKDEPVDLGESPVQTYGKYIVVQQATTHRPPIVIVSGTWNEPGKSRRQVDDGVPNQWKWFINSLDWSAEAWSREEWRLARCRAPMFYKDEETGSSGWTNEWHEHEPREDKYSKCTPLAAYINGRGQVEVFASGNGIIARTHAKWASRLRDPSETSSLSFTFDYGVKGAFRGLIQHSGEAFSILYQSGGEVFEWFRKVDRGSSVTYTRKISKIPSSSNAPITDVRRIAPHSGPIGDTGHWVGLSCEFEDVTTNVVLRAHRDNEVLTFDSKTASVVVPTIFGQLSRPRLKRHLSPNSKDVRLRMMEEVIRFHQRWGTNATREYLDEIFFFAPVLIAQHLRESSEYQAAADWMRTVYDYSAKAGERRVFAGLSRTFAEELDWDRDDWLRDPLDAHGIARMRPAAYARFTFVETARILTEWADGEFARDTSESVPRARELYEVALDVLTEPELEVTAPAGCDLESLPAIIREALGTNHTPHPFEHSAIVYIRRLLSLINIPADRQEAVSNVETAISSTTGSGAHKLLAGMQQARDEVDLIPAPETLGEIWTNEETEYLPAVQTAISNSERERKMLYACQEQAEAQLKAGVASVAKVSVDIVESDPASVDAAFLADALAKTPHEDEPVSIAYETEVHQANTAAREQELDGDYKALMMSFVPTPFFSFCSPPNPVFKLTQWEIKNNLRKIRQGRTKSGMRRPKPLFQQVLDQEDQSLVDAAFNTQAFGEAASTQYRFKVLLQQARQLVDSASRVESAYLAALKDIDAETIRRMEAENGVEVSEASLEVDELRVDGARNDLKISRVQRSKASLRHRHYDRLISRGLLKSEAKALENMGDAIKLQKAIHWVQGASAAVSAAATVVAGVATGGAAAAAAGIIGGAGGLGGGAANVMSSIVSEKTMTASMQQTRASYIRRSQEWRFQRSLARKNEEIAEAQVDRRLIDVDIASQQRRIGELRLEHANDMLEYLEGKFLSIELYQWMIRVLRRAYRQILQDAANVARLAWRQLVFERQQRISNPFSDNYWLDPQEPGDAFGANHQTTERRGLTGSTRLVADLATLEQEARDTNERRLQLSETISIIQHAPDELYRLQSEGRMSFASTLEIFDRQFPGHYQRLIEQVKVSLVALTPARTGVRASLYSPGWSKAVVSDNTFSPVEIRREPQRIAFTSPHDANGLFELEPQNELLRPFEGLGVETTFELELPKSANPWDFNSIADVLITIEYSALHDDDKYQRTINSLPPTTVEQRSFSLRNDFADEWYKLINERNGDLLPEITYALERSDFRPSLSNFSVRNLRMYLVTEIGPSSLQDMRIDVLHSGELDFDEGHAKEGMATTRRVSTWGSVFSGSPQSPLQEWTFKFPDGVDPHPLIALVDNDDLNDIVFVVEYEAELPEWPSS